MRTGPPPKPTRLKVLAGNPGRRPLNLNEPQFTAVTSKTPPRDLPPEAKREWRRIVPELQANGLLTVVDLPSLIVYCRAWAQYVAAQKFLDKYGPVYHSVNKRDAEYWAEYPHVRIAENAAKMIDRMAQKFGFTPADRSRITGTKHAPEAVYDDFIESAYRR